MRLIHYWTWAQIALSLINAAAGFLIFLLALNGCRVRLYVLRVFSVYVVMVNVVSLVLGSLVAVNSLLYYRFYWASDLVGNMLLCLVAVEIASHVMPWRRAVFAVGLGVLSLLLFLVVLSFPSMDPEAMLNLGLVGGFAGTVILALLLFPGGVWPAGFHLLTVGLSSMVLSPVFGYLHWLNHGREVASVLMPALSLFGLACVGFALRPVGGGSIHS